MSDIARIQETYTSDEVWKIRREADAEVATYRSHNWKLQSFLDELFGKLISFSIFLWAVVYVGAVLWAWYWKEDRQMAVAIILSLTVAHSSVAFTGYLRRKRKELTEMKK